MRPPEIVARVGDYTLTNIKSTRLRLSMRELADSFTLQISDRVDIVAGAPVGIAVNGRVVLLGEVMTTRLTKKAGVRDYMISGFSAAQRLVKSSVVLEQRVFRNRSVRQICEQVCEPFGISVDVANSANEIADEALERVKVEDGERCYDLMRRVAERQGCVLMSGAPAVEDGRARASVQIARVAYERSAAKIAYGDPRTLDMSYEDDVREMHSEYFVTRRGGGVRDEDGSLEGLDGRAVDERLKYSPIILQAEGGGRSQASLDRQAEWNMRKRSAEGQHVRATVLGWGAGVSSPQLWVPNVVHRVVDSEEGYDEQLVLATAEIAVSTQGSISLLEFMPPDAYAILEQPKKKNPKRKGGEKIGIIELSTRYVTQKAGLVATAKNPVSKNLGEDLSDLFWKVAESDFATKPEGDT